MNGYGNGRIQLKAIYANQLAFFDRSATPSFWDQRWEGSRPDTFRVGVPRHVERSLHRWVPLGKRCLEAGCGLGNIVYGLTAAGWPCVGIDYAESTVNRLKAAAPELDVRLGDVRCLPFPDDCFDCYISRGVIEHYPDGYTTILDEMDRVLRKGGIAIIEFPAINLVRKLKKRIGLYPHAASLCEDGLEFYQYALEPSDVQHSLEELGYDILGISRFEGFLGVADEAPRPLDRLLRSIYNHPSRLASWFRRAMEPCVAPWAGYCAQIVAGKTAGPSFASKPVAPPPRSDR